MSNWCRAIYESFRVPIAWRDFPYLQNGEFEDIGRKALKKRIQISHNCRIQLRQELHDEELQLLMSWRAMLISVLSAWATWQQTILALRFTLLGAFFGVFLSLTLPGSLKYVLSQFRESHIWNLSVLTWIGTPIYFGAVYYTLRAPAYLMQKVERATFVLEVLNEVIEERRALTVAPREVAATTEARPVDGKPVAHMSAVNHVDLETNPPHRIEDADFPIRDTSPVSDSATGVENVTPSTPAP